MRQESYSKQLIIMSLFFLFITACGNNSTRKINQQESVTDSYSYTETEFITDETLKHDADIQSICIEEKTKCENGKVLICINNSWSFQEKCFESDKKCKVLNGIAQCVESDNCINDSVQCNSNAVERCENDEWILMQDCSVSEETCIEISSESAECSSENSNCGNGIIEQGESCDDGNNISGDGCDSECNIEYDSRFDFEGPVYKGDTLLIINASINGDDESFTGTLPAGLTNHAAHSKQEDIIKPLPLSPIIPIPEGLTVEDLASVPVGVRMFNVGDSRRFYVANENQQYDTITATKKYVGDYCEIWVEYGESISQSQILSFAEEFDDVIYPMVVETFHEPSDINNDNLVAILFTDLGTFAGGYFSPGDWYSKSEHPQSNEMDMIYINPRVGMDRAYSVIAHEFQHLVHNYRNVIVEQDMQMLNDLSYRWIDEGFAMSSMHYYNGVQSDRISMYNQDYAAGVSEGHSLLYWDYYNTQKVYMNYALTYLFWQYFRIQSGDKKEFFKEIILDERNNNASIEAAVKKYINPGMSLSDIMINFRLALLMNEPDGYFGFHDEYGLSTSPSYYRGTGTNLRGGGSIFKQIPGSFTEPSDKGSNIIYVGIKTK